MCGRYTLTKPKVEVESRFKANYKSGGYVVTYNAAPTQLLPVITNIDNDQIQNFYWGLVPSWATDRTFGNHAINARSETLHEKPAFKHAFKHQRCLVIADSYYEWKKVGKTKIPYRILMETEEPFAMAGLWEYWKKGGEMIWSFSVVTTHANEKLAPLHERMPVILSAEDEEKWLSNKVEESELVKLFVPQPSNLFKTYSVDTAVNSVRNNDAKLIKPFAQPIQQSLF